VLITINPSKIYSALELKTSFAEYLIGLINVGRDNSKKGIE